MQRFNHAKIQPCKDSTMQRFEWPPYITAGIPTPDVTNPWRGIKMYALLQSSSENLL
jgi:hypothetical protein